MKFSILQSTNTKTFKKLSDLIILQNHQYMKITKNHVFKTIEEGQLFRNDQSDDKEIVNCNQHDKELSLFCVTCDIQLCSDCVTPVHTGHDIRDFGELVEGLREMLRKGMTQFT